MFSRASSSVLRRALIRQSPLAHRFAAPSRPMVTVHEAVTAEDAKAISCYNTIDYTITEDSTVYDAVQRFAAFNVGCLVVTNDAGKFKYLLLASLSAAEYFV